MEASVFNFIFASLEAILAALPVTLVLTVVPLGVGLLLGVPCAVCRRFQVPYAAALLKNVAQVLKGIPAILLVLLINYLILKPIDYLALQYEWAAPLQTMNKIYIGLVALSVYAVVQLTETALSALTAVEEGQYEAAYSVGLTRRQTLQRIVLPQAVPIALPLLGNNVIGLLKTTSIVYLISVNDILSAAMNSAAVNFRYLEAYIAVAVVYWAVCILVERAFILLEAKSRRTVGG